MYSKLTRYLERKRRLVIFCRIMAGKDPKLVRNNDLSLAVTVMAGKDPKLIRNNDLSLAVLFQ